MSDFWTQIFGNKTLEDVQEEQRLRALKMSKENPPRIMTFQQFHKRRLGGLYNLYIIWRGKQALYVGISRQNIWGRWFSRGGQEHIFNSGGQWHADFSSPIGKAIIHNRPASLRWKIELRYTPSRSLAAEEQELIQELRPLFNTIYRPSLTSKELKLYNMLTKV